MQVPLEIAFHGLDHSDAMETQVRERMDRLERYHDRMTSCRVVVEKNHRKHAKGNLFHVQIDIRVPGHEIVVNRDPKDHHSHEDVAVAIRDAFSAVRRQLEHVMGRSHR